MANRNEIAKKIRLDKEANPDYYCSVERCLWRTWVRVKGTQFQFHRVKCGNHPNAPIAERKQ